MTRIVTSEHCVFMIRAWRATPDSPWEFVLHRSGTNQTEYACGQPELLTVLSRQFHEDSANCIGSGKMDQGMSG